jgi:hypothetical protein
MSTDKIPEKMALYAIVQTNNYGGPTVTYTAIESLTMDGYAGSGQKWKLLRIIDVDWGELPQFDEKGAMIEALTAHMGEAQGVINKCKEEISKLLAIGHDGGHPEEVDPFDMPIPPRPAPVNDFDKFDDDIPF